MDISARSYLTAGISLTAATAIAFTPFAIPAAHPTVTVPHVVASDIELTVSPSDVAGLPGQTLIGVATTIETLFDVGFSGLIDATDDPTVAASLTILKTLSVDAYAMLAHNLGRINPLITGTTTEVGSLLTTAVIAAVLASGPLLAGNAVAAVKSLGDAGFGITGIAVDELTFQFNNAVSGLSELATQLGEASGSPTAEAVVRVAHGLAVAPTIGVVNLGSAVVGEVLTTANAGFDGLLGTATDTVQPASTDRSADRSSEQEPIESASADSDTEDSDETHAGADADEAADDAAAESAGPEDEDTASGDAANDQATPDKDSAPADQNGDSGADTNDDRSATTND